MVSVAFTSLLAVCVLGATWTGKMDETYTLSYNELRPESGVYDDGHLYLSHIKGQTLTKVDVDDLEDGKTTEATKFTESEPHNLGTSLWPIGCCEGESDRIYCTIGSVVPGTTNNGIGYWDMDDLTFKDSIQYSTASLAADCIVDDDYVYWTASYSGQVFSCDHDLDTCNLITDSTLLAGISSGSLGAMGVVHIEEDGEEFLVIANPGRGELVKVPVSKGVLNGVPANVVITDTGNIIDGADGLVKIADDVLISVGPSYVILYETEDNWTSATIKKSLYIKEVEGANQWGGANAIVRSDDKDEIKIYVTFPGFTSYFGGTTQSSFKLGYVKFSDEDVDDLDFSLALMTALLAWFF